MTFPFNRDRAVKILKQKRELLGRGLSYTEKVLFLHQMASESEEGPLVRGQDIIRLFPDRVAMQDATAQMAMLQFIQAGTETSQVSATIHCDHLVTACDGAGGDLERALDANREVYDFLCSAALKYGLGFWGPGSGIIHQVVLENYALPGSLMVGTDSHTPNAGGLGMIAVGVGGADAAEVMAGLPWETICPRIVGVRLKGRLAGWASAKDVIIGLLGRLSVKGGTGKIFEYFGEGALTLSATEKATITNMGAELGATASVFPYDETMDAYLRNVGRRDEAEWAKSMGDILKRDGICDEEPWKVYDEILDIDLGAVEPAYAGPFSPDRVTEVKDFKKALLSWGLPVQVSAVLVGSCTNSSFSDLWAVSDVLEQGAARGLKVKVPFLLAPGSRRVFETAKREGILDRITGSGGTILASACGPCIGQWDRKDMEKGTPNCIFTTFNRNFRGRNDSNPETRAFMTSPAMAAALALSGDAGFDPRSHTLKSSHGDEFMLRPPEPPDLPEEGLVQWVEGFIPPSKIDPERELKIEPGSDRLEILRPFAPWDGQDFHDLPVLVKTRGKTTTDHISPGGPWLRYRGHLRNISRNLLEGAVNAFTGETGRGTNVLTGEKGIRFSDLALYYRDRSGGFVIIGDENYGEGSSREHAAMSPRFLGAKAVIAKSFARIHEANLKKQGILPLTFEDPKDYEKIGEHDRISLVGLAGLEQGKPLKGFVKKPDGTAVELTLDHTLTEEHIRWFRAGSSLNASPSSTEAKQGKF